MTRNKKVMDKNRILVATLSTLLAVTLILLSGAISFAWFISKKTVDGRGTLGNVSLGDTKIELPNGTIVMPGHVLIGENQSVTYTGQPAYYRVKINLDFFKKFENGVYSEPVVVEGVDEPVKFGKIGEKGSTESLTEPIKITDAGETISLPTSITTAQAGYQVRIVLDITAIQQANLPIDIKTAEAAFKWYDVESKLSKIELNVSSITLPDGTSATVKKELGTGVNEGKFKLTKEASAKSSKTVSSTKKAIPEDAEFYFFADKDVNDDNWYTLTFKQYYLDVWYDLPAEQINLQPVHLTPNYDGNTLNKKDGNIVIAHSVTSIEDKEFSYCDLISVIMPDSVTSIGEKSFYSSYKLKNIIIPNSVLSVGDDAFSSTAWDSNNNNEIIYVGKCLYRYNRNVEECVIKDGTTCIASKAFDNCTSLTSIMIPDSVTSIGVSAFSRCSKLANIKMSKNVINMSNNVFDYTEWYKNQPDGLVYAGRVLYKYKGTCPSEITKIEQDTIAIANFAFNYCSNLTSITIPNSVQCIGEGAFQGCGLISIKIPDSVESIGKGAFAMCNNLTNIIVENNKNYSSLNGVLYNKNKTVLYAYPIGKKDVSFEMPSSVKIIESHAFEGGVYLTSIIIGSEVVSIGASAFSSCNGLTMVEMPNSVEFIGEMAFSCDNLISVKIGSNVNRTGYGPFGEYPRIKTIIIDSPLVANTGEGLERCNPENIYIKSGLNVGNAITAMCPNKVATDKNGYDKYTI